MSRPAAVELDGAQNAAQRGVGRGRREERLAAVPVLQVSRVVVTKAVIEGELTSYFPGVLDVSAEYLLAETRIDGVGDADVVDQTQQETGISRSPAGSR